MTQIEALLFLSLIVTAGSAIFAAIGRNRYRDALRGAEALIAELEYDLEAARADADRDVDELAATLDRERAERARVDDAKLWAHILDRMPERITPSPPWPPEALDALLQKVGGNLDDLTFYVFATGCLPGDPSRPTAPAAPSALASWLAKKSNAAPVAFWFDGRQGVFRDPPKATWAEARSAARAAGLVRGLFAALERRQAEAAKGA